MYGTSNNLLQIFSDLNSRNPLRYVFKAFLEVSKAFITVAKHTQYLIAVALSITPACNAEQIPLKYYPANHDGLIDALICPQPQPISSGPCPREWWIDYIQ